MFWVSRTYPLVHVFSKARLVPAKFRSPLAVNQKGKWPPRGAAQAPQQQPRLHDRQESLQTIAGLFVVCLLFSFLDINVEQHIRNILQALLSFPEVQRTHPNNSAACMTTCATGRGPGRYYRYAIF